MKKNYLSISFILLCLLLLSCSTIIEKSPYPQDETVLHSDSNFTIRQIFSNKKNEESITKKTEPIEKVVNDDCGKLELDVWQFHHYEPSETKFLGIWPTANRYNNFEKIKDLKDKWGFKLIFIQAHWVLNDFEKFAKAGFSDENILIDLNLGLPKYIPDWEKKFKNVYGFYVDEPYSAKPNYSVNQFAETYKKIKKLNGPLFITGDFKPSDCLDDYVRFADKIMFTSYKRTYQLFGCVFRHWPENIDQSDSWEVMKNRYGNKFTSTWIGAHSDTLEYFQLFKKASELNLESVWFYQLQDETDLMNESNLAKFCEAAWQFGYLKKVIEKVRYEFECKDENNLCNCDVNNPNDWELKAKKKLNNFSEEIFNFIE